MRRIVYSELVKLLDLPVGSCPNMKVLQQLFPGVQATTLMSVFSQENQYKVIKSNHLHRQRIHEYCARYLAGEDILVLSANVDFPPCMLMRRMLECFLCVHKQHISDILRCPAMLSTLTQGDGSTAGALASTSITLPEPLVARLQEDVTRCALADCSYSPYTDAAKQSAGLEYELLLCLKLRMAGISYFWTEADLRTQGYYKTPDVWLQVPIAVRDRTQGADAPWRVVTWIDSKATFGDDRTHSKQLDDQYRTYVNRYGPGLVIYWFGYIDDLDSDPEVTVLDHFPETTEITLLLSDSDIAT